MNLTSRMKGEVQRNLDKYLDSARCFDYTGLAEEFINVDEPEDEEEYFDTAVEVGEYATKKFSLNR